MHLQDELQAFLEHDPRRPAHVAAAPTEPFDLGALRRVGDLTSASLHGPSPTPLTAGERAVRLMRTSRRATASMPFDVRFGYAASNDWLFAEMAAPALAVELRRLLDAGEISAVLETGLDAAALTRDHEMMVAIGSNGQVPWIPAIVEVLRDAVKVAEPRLLERFVSAEAIIEDSWPAVSERIALSRVLGPGLKHVRDGKRLLDLDLPDEIREPIERASTGFGSIFPAPIYTDLDFLWGTLEDWHAAAFECADVVDAGRDAVNAERQRLETLICEDARLLPRYKWIGVGAAIWTKRSVTLKCLRELRASANRRLEDA